MRQHHPARMDVMKVKVEWSLESIVPRAAGIISTIAYLPLVFDGRDGLRPRSGKAFKQESKMSKYLHGVLISRPHQDWVAGLFPVILVECGPSSACFNIS